MPLSLQPHFVGMLKGKVKAWSSVSQLLLPPRTSAEGGFPLSVPITLEGKFDHLSKERNPVWKEERIQGQWQEETLAFRVIFRVRRNDHKNQQSCLIRPDLLLNYVWPCDSHFIFWVLIPCLLSEKLGQITLRYAVIPKCHYYVYQRASKIIIHVIFATLLKAWQMMFYAWARPLLNSAWKPFQKPAIRRQAHCGWLSSLRKWTLSPPRPTVSSPLYSLNTPHPHPRFLILTRAWRQRESPPPSEPPQVASPAGSAYYNVG